MKTESRRYLTITPAHPKGLLTYSNILGQGEYNITYGITL